MEKSNFEILAAVDCKDKIEKKNGLSYLSWAWAVDQLLRKDAQANWSFGEPKQYGETMMVFCTVTAFGKPMTAFLPVMDYRNKPIANPDAFAVNTAMQRCLVKAIALHGLGLYIYAGEDIPEESTTTVKSKATGETHVLPDPAPNFPRGVSPTGGLWEALEPDMQTYLTDIADGVRSWLVQGLVKEALEEVTAANLDTDQKAALWTRFNKEEKKALSGK